MRYRRRRNESGAPYRPNNITWSQGKAGVEGLASILLKGELDRISVTVHFVQSMPAEDPERKAILPLLQEWLHVWGGRMEYLMLSDETVNLTGSLGANTSV